MAAISLSCKQPRTYYWMGNCLVLIWHESDEVDKTYEAFLFARVHNDKLLLIIMYSCY